MCNDADSFSRDFYQELERRIAEMAPDIRAKLFRPCAVKCVKDKVLPELRRQFEECGCDLDRQYEKYGRSEYFFADIIERGHIYELGYPRCLCPTVEAGFTSLPVHCECSRESIIYVLETLLPEKNIQVRKLHTVLDGAKECRFRVTVE